MDAKYFKGGQMVLPLRSLGGRGEGWGEVRVLLISMQNAKKSSHPKFIT
jgi:hypothetical protein